MIPILTQEEKKRATDILYRIAVFKFKGYPFPPIKQKDVHLIARLIKEKKV